MAIIEKKNMDKVVGILATLMYVIMIYFNAAANILPLNGITTAEVSKDFDTLLAPIGTTFIIWGLIYFGLGVHLIDLWRRIIKQELSFKDQRLEYMFSVTSVINAAWIVAWHYERIGLSLVLMLILFVYLYIIMGILKPIKEKKTSWSWIQYIPFHIYFAWICVAMAANIGALVVNIWPSQSDWVMTLWSLILLALTMALAGFILKVYDSYAYGLVVLWALVGILARHVSADEYDLNYMGMVYGTILAMIFIVVMLMYLRKRHQEEEKPIEAEKKGIEYEQKDQI